MHLEIVRMSENGRLILWFKIAALRAIPGAGFRHFSPLAGGVICCSDCVRNMRIHSLACLVEVPAYLRTRAPVLTAPVHIACHASFGAGRIPPPGWHRRPPRRWPISGYPACPWDGPAGLCPVPRASADWEPQTCTFACRTGAEKTQRLSVRLVGHCTCSLLRGRVRA